MITEHPGAVKMVGESGLRLYHMPFHMACVERRCSLKTWNDIKGDGFWVQHGPNPESVRFFNKRYYRIPPGYRSAARPDVLAWINECHAHEDQTTP